MQEELRRKVVGALKHGLSIHIAMTSLDSRDRSTPSHRNTAVAFKEKFCAEGSFPQSLFKVKDFKGEDKDLEQRPYRSIIKEEDLKDWPGGAPGWMREGGLGSLLGVGKLDEMCLWSEHMCFIWVQCWYPVGFHLVITTDFEMESAKDPAFRVGLPFQDFLKDALPFLEDMAVIEIDPDSFG